MLLSDDESATFALWLELQISTSARTQAQLEKSRAPLLDIDRVRFQQLACKVVLKMITSGESMSITTTGRV